MTYISTAISNAISESNGASPFSDVRFGKVYEALELVLQGLLRVGLEEREVEEKEIEDVEGEGDGEEGETVKRMKESDPDGVLEKGIGDFGFLASARPFTLPRATDFSALVMLRRAPSPSRRPPTPSNPN